jgi:hypothetical protein
MGNINIEIKILGRNSKEMIETKNTNGNEE